MWGAGLNQGLTEVENSEEQGKGIAGQQRRAWRWCCHPGKEEKG